MKLKFLAFYTVTLIFAFCILHLPASATNMSSDNYKIQWGNINIGGGKPTSDNYQLGVTMGQIAPGLFSGDGYTVRSGFQYIQSIVPFTFRISDRSIDFGSLTPQTPSTDSNELTVSAGSAGGWQVLAFENHPLRLKDAVSCAGGNCIDDTTCDNGNCTETSAEVWTQGTTYGFGFNIDGDNIPADFAGTTHFRQFANDETSEAHSIVMTSNEATRSAQATVTYKANIDTLQKAGNYDTNITFIAVPKY